MKMLLDTCTFLWIAEDSPRLSNRARDLYRDPSNQLYLSCISAWEICTKFQFGRLNLTKSPAVLIADARMEMNLLSVDFDEKTAMKSMGLPPIHKDPFDRMLICQALEHDLTILTPDPAIRAYQVATDW